MGTWSPGGHGRRIARLSKINPKAEKVQFRDKHVKLVGWIKALAFNIINDFKECLDKKYHKMTAGTIVRKFLDRPATITTTADEIIVLCCNLIKLS